MSEDVTLDEFIESEGTETDEVEEEGLREEGFLTLPYDWDISTVNEVAKEGGLVDGDWIESADMDEDGGIQLVQLAHIGEGQFKGEPDRFINEAFAEEEECTILSKGDLLISRMQEPILRACLLPSFEQDSVMAVDIARLQEKKEWNRHLLKYLFNSRPVWKQGIAWASGTTRKRISRKNIEKLRLPTPPLLEQRKIATVLYTVDRAIEKTEHIINHIKNLRKATIDELFTSGYERHFKQHIDYIGPREVEYPSGWDIVELGNLTKKITKGKTPTSYGYDYTDSGVNFIKVESILESGKFDKSEFDHIGEEAHNHLSGSELIAGDILFSIAGALGKVAQIDESVLPANTNQALALIRIDDPRVLPEYIRRSSRYIIT